MIPNDKLHKEKRRQARYIQKPTGGWMGYSDPEKMGLHQMQKRKRKKAS